MSIAKRKYTEEIPESAKYKTPQASLPARRTQVKLLPDGKTQFTQNEIIRIMIPPQGYFDPEYSYLSFDVILTAPKTYKLKALEVWNRDSHCFVYDTKISGIVLFGRPETVSRLTTTATAIDITPTSSNITTTALSVPLIRHAQDISATMNGPSSSDILYEWVPVGQIYPVLPYSSHGFFTRVVLRTSNNTPIEDIQDYDFLSAHLGSLLQSQGYSDTMGAMIEGWGDINTRAKMGLACVENLEKVNPTPRFAVLPIFESAKITQTEKSFSDIVAADSMNHLRKTAGAVEGVGDEVVLTKVNSHAVSHMFVYSDYTGSSVSAVKGLSPEGVDQEDFREQKGSMKFTCNLNLGLFQQAQNLPLLFSGGLILELYTAPFDRCISFTSIQSKIDAMDFPNMADSEIQGSGLLVDITAMNCRLPKAFTDIVGLPDEISSVQGGPTLRQGEYFNYTHVPYASSGVVGGRNFVQPGLNHTSIRALSPFKQQVTQGGTTLGVSEHLADNANLVSENISLLKKRMDAITTGWSYRLTNVELRADMVQFSQSYDEEVAEIVDSDEGLPITFQTFSTQKVSYGGKRSTLTINERARSIQFALAVFKDSTMEKRTHTILYDNDTRYVVCNDNVFDPYRYVTSAGVLSLQPRQMETPYKFDYYQKITTTTNLYDSALYTNQLTANLSVSCPKFVGIANPYTCFARVLPVNIQEQSLYPNLVDYQFRVGTRYIPASPVDCTGGAVQAYIELMKAIGMYGSFSGTGQRANMPGNRITPDLYAKRICTAASKTLAGAYYSVLDKSATSDKARRNVVVGDLEMKDYLGLRYRIPQRFILGMNFSDIPDHAAGVDTATQALAIELALNGDAKESDGVNYNVYLFLNVRRDMFVRCGGQIEILY